MNQEEYLLLLDLLQRQLKAAGLQEIADMRPYLDEEADGAPASSRRPRTPKVAVLLTLEAFQRHLKANDPMLAERSLERIAGRIDRPGIRALIEPDPAEEVFRPERDSFDLSQLRKTDEVQNQLSQLIKLIHEDEE